MLKIVNQIVTCVTKSFFPPNYCIQVNQIITCDKSQCSSLVMSMSAPGWNTSSWVWCQNVCLVYIAAVGWCIRKYGDTGRLWAGPGRSVGTQIANLWVNKTHVCFLLIWSDIPWQKGSTILTKYQYCNIGWYNIHLNICWGLLCLRFILFLFLLLTWPKTKQNKKHTAP